MSDRRLWTLEEDQIITVLVTELGSKKWTQVAQQMNQLYPGFVRSSKQIRQRWHNHLNPQINKNSWSQQEENIIFDAHKKIGSKWKDIAKLLHARTDNSVKNYFYSSLRRSLRRINKFVGFKNSTNQMRLLKPSILSKLIEDGDKNQESRILVHGISLFSKYKPSKSQQIKSTSQETEEKNMYLQAIQSLINFNDKFEKKQRKTKKYSKHKQSRSTQHQNQKLQKHQQLLTTTDQFTSKSMQNIQDIKLMEQIQEEKQQFSRQDWSQSSHNFMVQFPELERPEQDNDFLQLVCKQEQDF